MPGPRLRTKAGPNSSTCFTELICVKSHPNVTPVSRPILTPLWVLFDRPRRDPHCLAFHKTERPVITASTAQVRQPLYKTAIGRFKPYEA